MVQWIQVLALTYDVESFHRGNEQIESFHHAQTEFAGTTVD